MNRTLGPRVLLTLLGVGAAAIAQHPSPFLLLIEVALIAAVAAARSAGLAGIGIGSDTSRRRLAAGLLATGGTALAAAAPTLGYRASSSCAAVLVAAVYPLAGDRPRERAIGLGVCALPLVTALGLAERLEWPLTLLGVVGAVTALLALAELRVHPSTTPDASAPPPPGERAPVLPALACVALLATLCCLLLPTPRAPILRAADDAQPTPEISRRDATFGSGSLDLRSRGALPHSPMWSLPSDSPVRWRDEVLSVYDGSTWWTPEASGAQTLGSDGVVPPTLIDRGPWPSATRWFEVRRLAAAAHTPAIVPGRPLRILAPTAVTVAPNGSVDIAQVDSPAAPQSYRVLVADGTTRPTPGAAAQQLPDRPAWLQLPPLPQRVSDLAGSLAEHGSLPAQQLAARIEDYLRARETYDLSAAVPANGEDAVDDFLFNSHHGYCEHFASAEVVLLRAAGVPARLVTGFASGADADAATGRRVIYGDDAHAWVEFWAPGTGWSTSDPTQGARLGTPSPLARLAGAKSVAIALALALATALALGRSWAIGSRRRRTRRVVAPQVPGHRPRDAFHRLELRELLRGRPRRRGQTVGSFAERFSDHPGLRHAIDVVQRDLYDREAVPGGEARAAADRIDQL